MKYNPSLVSIVVPTKNEGAGLLRILNSVKPYAKEIIVVDGHSTDNTFQIVRGTKAKYLPDHGLGRGDGVRTGLAKASGKVAVLFDADGSHEATDIPRFVLPIVQGRADVVIGSRRTGGSFDLNMDFSGILRSGGADFLAYLVNRKFHTKLSDILYSFRAVRRSVVPKLELKSDDFGIEQEMVVKCLAKGFRLLEIPSREKARAWGKSKLKTIMGVKFVWELVRQLYLSNH